MRSLFFDSLHFIVAVLLAWWSTPVAALSAGGVAMAEAIREKKISKRVFVVLGIAYLFFACFFVWRDERLKAQEGQQKILALTASRPYFSLQKSEIETAKQEETGESVYHVIVLVLVNSSDHPATQIRLRLFLVDTELKQEPMGMMAFGTANDVDRNAPLTISSPYSIPPQAPPVFIICEASYHDAVALGTELHQTWYLKFGGSLKLEGLDKKNLFNRQIANADSDEKARIDAYMSKRGIALP